MPCGVKTCTVNDDHLLWRCTYCDKKYHAACIGVQRHREHIITAFMVPMCAECQDILKKEADVRKLLYQQDKLLKAMHSQNDTNLRIAADLRKFSLVSALFESIERLLNEVNETLAMVNKNNESIRSAISQHMESCDSRVATVVTDINLSNCTLSQKINNLFEDRLTCLRNDMALLTRNTESLTTSINQASHQSTHDSQLREILEEVKFVSANLSGLKLSNTNDLLPNKTLEEELAEITQINEASMTLEEELAENIPRHQQQTPPQQTIEQQQPEPLPASNKPASNAIAELFAERRAKMSKQSAGAPPKNEHSSSGWRMIGNKRCWKQDWSGYDIKRSARQLQEKTADKARHSRKRRKQQRARINSQQLAKKTNNNKPHMGTDKELLATAKTQFSVPPSSIDHPIAGLSVPKPISFRKGEIINPYRAEKQMHPTNNIASLPTGNATPSLSLQGPNQQNQQQQQPQNQALCSSETRFDLDPMRPPIVRLTEQSTEGDGRFLKARLRDPKIMGIVRLFLAYMKDQPATVCVEGLTPTSIRMLLASEGLPTDPEHLLRIFSDVHQEYGLDPTAAMADLQSYRQYLSSERTHRLQQLRESANKFSSPSPFRK